MSVHDRSTPVQLLQRWWKPVLLSLLAIFLILAAIFNWFDLRLMLTDLDVTATNPSAPYLFILILVLASILGIPTLFFALLAGPIFGFTNAVIFLTIGINIGAQLTFWVGRLLGRQAVERVIHLNRLSSQLTQRLDQRGFVTMLLLRLSLIIPYNLINYISGLTRIRYRDYALGSLIGMLPGTVLYVQLSMRAAEARENPWPFIAICAALTLLIAVMRRLYQRRDHDG
ncbi:MAG: TVP38/TMEM64 family protein [Clostridia bacterium]|nr:TVP38/TMEM64 family protein [Eubacteriales bacterium]MDD3867223.1 TVP38/TMEM64 family protein [Eubacteriales bacterium]NCC48134.1 TVP38/TMEM64 family protein [Clostridia bacterium]